MIKIAKITRTLQIVSNCWLRAEERLRDDPGNNYASSNEELITQVFHAKLAAELREASEKRLISEAFLADLTAEFHELAGKPELHRVAKGLVADVTLHERETEKNTGGDLGLLIIRPQAQFSAGWISVKDYRRGLLCQAKLKKASGKWGGFTKRQKVVLPQRLSYLALLLYRYKDGVQRILDAFGWQLCNSVEFSEVERWLKNGTFPSQVGSAEIIQYLGNGDIGTDNDKTIDEEICPAKNPSLVIKIHWPRGNPPSERIELSLKHELKQPAERLYVQATAMTDTPQVVCEDEEPLTGGNEKVFA
jgi:hypothetical protein